MKRKGNGKGKGKEIKMLGKDGKRKKKGEGRKVKNRKVLLKKSFWLAVTDLFKSCFFLQNVPTYMYINFGILFLPTYL